MKADGHFPRKLKAIAKKVAAEGAELYRFRKTYADTLHEEGVPNPARARVTGCDPRLSQGQRC